MGEGGSNECHNTQETFDLDLDFHSSALVQLLNYQRKNLEDYLSTFLSNVFAASSAAFSWQREASHFVRC